MELYTKRLKNRSVLAASPGPLDRATGRDVLRLMEVEPVPAGSFAPQGAGHASQQFLGVDGQDEAAGGSREQHGPNERLPSRRDQRQQGGDCPARLAAQAATQAQGHGIVVTGANHEQVRSPGVPVLVERAGAGPVLNLNLPVGERLPKASQAFRSTSKAIAFR
jgi:hypothetical protein